jgi:hypothetical protein
VQKESIVDTTGTALLFFYMNAKKNYSTLFLYSTVVDIALPINKVVNDSVIKTRGEKGALLCTPYN